MYFLRLWLFDLSPVDLKHEDLVQFSTLSDYFFLRMATLRNKRELAVTSRENCNWNWRSNHARDTSGLRIQEGYITLVSDEIVGTLTKNLSQELNRTKNRSLGILSKLDDFSVNPQVHVHSGAALETSRNPDRENQGTNQDRSQNGPHP